MKRITKAFIKIVDKLENSCAIGAIRQGLIMMIPLLVVGYGALLLISLPIQAYQEFLTGLWDGRVVEILQFIHNGVNKFFAVILAVSTSVSYAFEKRRKTDIYVGIAEIIILAITTLVAFAAFSGIQYDTFSISYFNNMHSFTALIVALISGKIFFAMKNRKFLKFEKQGMNVDNSYVEAIQGIFPAIAILGFFALFKQLLQITFGSNGLQEVFEANVNHLLQFIDNGLAEGLILVIIIHIVWFFGIHGNNMLDVVMKQNFEDITAGIFSKTFQDVFVIMGGTGSVLCLVISILLFSKNKKVKGIAKMAIPTTAFNISELVLFGLPVILNPEFVIPFILVPVVNCVISYLAIYVGLVPPIVHSIEWTTPILLSGYQATASWKGAFLQVICVTIGVLIYKPFIQIYEVQGEKRFVQKVKNLVKELQIQEEKNMIMPLTRREDELGNVARILASELKEAVENKELFLMYQPQVDSEGVCIGAEALIRWKHPTVDFIYPPLIIQLAKEKNILPMIEEFIFDESAAAIARLEKEITGDFKISVNITNQSLEWDGMENCIEKYVKKYNISRKRLHLEITEQDALSSTKDVVKKINRLKSKGHKFLIDDFGMGHTSLLYFQTNCFDIVKLDRILSRDVLENERNSKIISSVVSLGKSLDFKIIAEWVETQEQRDELKRLGCDAFQGYLYSKPIDLEAFIVWVKEREG